MKPNVIKKTIAANITYSGNTFNTILFLEYKHTGEFSYKQGRKKIHTIGYYFIDRIAIPTINAKGLKDIWYINNSGDNYSINKVSKYAKKIHNILSKEQPPIN